VVKVNARSVCLSTNIVFLRCYLNISEMSTPGTQIDFHCTQQREVSREHSRRNIKGKQSKFVQVLKMYIFPFSLMFLGALQTRWRSHITSTTFFQI
jgi:hypothetical protein